MNEGDSVLEPTLSAVSGADENVLDERLGPIEARRVLATRTFWLESAAYSPQYSSTLTFGGIKPLPPLLEIGRVAWVLPEAAEPMCVRVVWPVLEPGTGVLTDKYILYSDEHASGSDQETESSPVLISTVM